MGRSRSLEMTPFDGSHTSSYLSSIITTTIFEIKRNIGRKLRFFHTPFYIKHLWKKRLRVSSCSFFHNRAGFLVC